MDKIGLEGVAEELEKEGFAKESIDTYLGLFVRSPTMLRVSVILKKNFPMFWRQVLQRILNPLSIL